MTLTVTNDAGSSTYQRKNYITPTNQPTAPPMLAGMLAKLLDPFSITASATGVAPETSPSGLGIGLKTIDGTNASLVDNSINGLSSAGGTNIAAV